ncbi:hypothetical protein L596_017621 [Steinernema carpocapsae]|uniref:Uncharacterized protein n=1 Tax=Steinernema carpocapsae TaxID=34508 RepID=A0A4V6A1S6_STECR|nr:hypothetical protein L596_017621 [Steinernema carpocapsae]
MFDVDQLALLATVWNAFIRQSSRTQIINNLFQVLASSMLAKLTILALFVACTLALNECENDDQCPATYRCSESCNRFSRCGQMKCVQTYKTRDVENEVVPVVLNVLKDLEAATRCMDNSDCVGVEENGVKFDKCLNSSMPGFRHVGQVCYSDEQFAVLKSYVSAVNDVLSEVAVPVVHESQEASTPCGQFKSPAYRDMSRSRDADFDNVHKDAKSCQNHVECNTPIDPSNPMICQDNTCIPDPKPNIIRFG